jgi:hypothetical protein
MKKTQEGDHRRDGYLRRPSTFRYQRSFNHCEGNNRREYCYHPRHDFRRTTSQRISFTPRYESFFYGHCFICINFRHKVADCRAFRRNGQAINAYVTPYNIGCYKFHNYGHIASFWLVSENSGSWCFLQVGAYKSGGWCLLPVGAGEFGSCCFL